MRLRKQHVNPAGTTHFQNEKLFLIIFTNFSFLSCVPLDVLSLHNPIVELINKLIIFKLPASVHRQTFFKNPPLFTAGKMQYLYDSEGKRYIDCFGGICTVSAGHAHEKVRADTDTHTDTHTDIHTIFS